MEIFVVIFLATLSTIFLVGRLWLVKKYFLMPLDSNNRHPKPFRELVQQVFPKFSEPNDERLDSTQKANPSSSNIPNQSRKRIDSLSLFSGLGESAWLGADMIHNLQAVNQHVFDALSQMAGKQLLSIGDLHNHIDNWEHDWLGGLKDSTIDNLQGHVAEYVVADHLRQLGHNVQFAGQSNQAGYDFIVDGHPVNVKDVVDMTSIHEHFQKYPDIPVIVNGDIHGNLENTLHIDAAHGIDQLNNLDNANPDHFIIEDSGLDHDAVVGQVHDASDAITGNIEFHIPLITLTLSSYREGKLLLKKHTDIATSLKNIGLDVAGTGIGGLAGAKLGAAIGTAIAPGPGSLIGGIIGAVAGAIGGRLVTNKVKTEPFRQAKDSYKVSLKSYKATLKEVDEKAKKDYDQAIDTESARLNKLAEQERQQILELKEKLTKNQRQSYCLDNTSLSELFKKAQSILQKELYGVTAEINSLPFFQRYIWPSEIFFKLNHHKKRLLAEMKDLEASIKTIFSTKLNQSSEEKTNTAFEILCALGLLDTDILKHLFQYKNTVDTTKSRMDSSIESAKHKLSDERHKSFLSISDTIEKIKSWAEKELRPVTKTLKQSQRSLLTEMRKLGIETK